MTSKHNNERFPDLQQVEMERGIYNIAGYVMNPYKANEKEFVKAKNDLITSLERDIHVAKCVSFESFQYRYKPRP